MPGRVLAVGQVEGDALGAAVLAHEREEGKVAVELGPRELAILAEMPWPIRRGEWLAGRRAAKALLQAVHGFSPARVEVLPAPSQAPEVFVDGVRRHDVFITLSHTRRYVAAATAPGPVGVDLCDDADGERLPRIARRVFSEGEAEACGAHDSRENQAAVWALKEAGLKLRIGGVFDPGARSVRVVSLEPAAVADPTMRVQLWRLPDAALAIARER